MCAEVVDSRERACAGLATAPPRRSTVCRPLQDVVRRRPHWSDRCCRARRETWHQRLLYPRSTVGTVAMSAIKRVIALLRAILDPIDGGNRASFDVPRSTCRGWYGAGRPRAERLDLLGHLPRLEDCHISSARRGRSAGAPRVCTRKRPAILGEFSRALADMRGSRRGGKFAPVRTQSGYRRPLWCAAVCRRRIGCLVVRQRLHADHSRTPDGRDRLLPVGYNVPA